MADERAWWERALAFSERRRLKQLVRRGNSIANLEPDMERRSDAELAAVTGELKQKLANGASLDDVLPEAFAAVREAGKRTLQMRHFDVQMVGGIALHEGSVAEMLTGEGKTLVATLPLYLNALTGQNVHLVTANDYLARRDAEWMGPIYTALGMRVSSIYNMQPRQEKREAYSADITYGTNSEFGFDYLRDNMAYSKDELLQRGHYYAIVDEADSILIDEARTPLIISGKPEEAAETYHRFARIVAKMENGVHFEFDEKMHTAHPTEEGVDFTEKQLGIENLYLPENGQLVNHLIQAIRAQALYHRDKEYVVVDGEVKIVDEHTGRIMEGRRWSEGLHQAVEAKEGVRPREENVTVASITIQNYFRLYSKLAGMTGTASTEAAELKEIYNLDVVEVPPNRPVQRLDQNDFIFKTEEGKWQALVRDIEERNTKGQPVLVGTIAVEKSERLSDVLTRKGIQHEVLNAKNHAREAEIILGAGQPGAVTIATNMAGRGVDIKLGEGVQDLGGLYVLATERHESRRIDNQLRGRSGRQGDPGESRFYISAQDDLVRVFAGDKMANVLARFKSIPDDEPIDSGMLSRTIKGAQKRVEERNFVMRKNVLKYDDVLNTQRHVVYDQRRQVLDGHDIRSDIMEWLRDAIDGVVNAFTADGFPEDWDLNELLVVMKDVYPTALSVSDLGDVAAKQPEELAQQFFDEAVALYESKEAEYGAATMRDVERVIFLQVLDTRWREHLDNMDYLRDGIGLRGLAQKNPLGEYQSEGYIMFQELQAAVQGEVIAALLRVELQRSDGSSPNGEAQPQQTSRMATTMDLAESADDDGPAAPTGVGTWSGSGNFTYTQPAAPTALEAERAARGEEPDTSRSSTTVQQRVVGEKVGRNDPCPCGSGLKYKKCHGATA